MCVNVKIILQFFYFCNVPSLLILKKSHQIFFTWSLHWVTPLDENIIQLIDMCMCVDIYCNILEVE